jgi:glutathione peroxidase
MIRAIMTFFDLEAPTIDRVNQPLSAYAGKVLLVVNVASACGFTPQYAGLEALSARLAPRGFAVLGFPSNEFGAQEPGTEAEIKTFCDTRYHVTFPLFAKVRTKGADKSPVYQFLTAREGEPAWNFHKYLVGKDGQVIQAFPSKVKPDDPALLAAIEAALAAK